MKFVTLKIHYKPGMLLAESEQDAIEWLRTYPTVANDVIVAITSESGPLPSAEHLQGCKALYVTELARQVAPETVRGVIAVVQEAKSRYADRLIEPHLDA